MSEKSCSRTKKRVRERTPSPFPQHLGQLTATIQTILQRLPSREQRSASEAPSSTIELAEDQAASVCRRSSLGHEPGTSRMAGAGDAVPAPVASMALPSSPPSPPPSPKAMAVTRDVLSTSTQGCKSGEIKPLLCV